MVDNVTVTREELLPCPFCGDHGVYCFHVDNPTRTRHWILCRACHACPGDKLSEAEAITAWNSRLSPAQGVDARELPPFKEAWAKKEAAGYRYNGHALENVAFGYEIARQELKASRPPAEQVRMREALEGLVAAYTGDWVNCEEAIAQARAALTPPPKGQNDG